jgi:hypothetical protein
VTWLCDGTRPPEGLQKNDGVLGTRRLKSDDRKAVKLLKTAAVVARFTASGRVPGDCLHCSQGARSFTQ